MNCPICGANTVHEIRSPVVSELEGRTQQYEEVASHCSTCDNEFVLPAQLKANKRAAINAQWALIGAPQPAQLVAWRNRWRFTQEAAGKLLGVGPTAFSKYENTAMVPSSPTVRLLHAVILSDDTTRQLARQFGVEIQGSAGIELSIGPLVFVRVPEPYVIPGASWKVVEKTTPSGSGGFAVSRKSQLGAGIEIRKASTTAKPLLVKSH